MERLTENLGIVKQPKLPGALPLDPTRGVCSIPFEPPALMVYGHKSQSFMKNGGQQKSLDKASYSIWDIEVIWGDLTQVPQIKLR